MLIDKLTPDHEAKFSEYIEKWIKIGLCTDPADRPTAEKAIVESYKLAGLNPPKKIVWCGSPLSMGITRAIVLENSVRDSVRNSVKDSVKDSVGNSVRDSVRNSVWDSVRKLVRNSVGDSVENSVENSVKDSVGNSVGNSVRDSVWNSVYNSVRSSVYNSVGYSIYGQHDAGWLSFYDYFNEVVGLKEETYKVQGLISLAKSAGWALPYENICWVSERHQVLNRDNRGRLHFLTGPSVMYPDGWEIYAINGVLVPEKVVKQPESYTEEEIKNEKNSEVIRVLAERLGWDKFLNIIGSKRIDVWVDPRTGLVYELLDTKERRGELQPRFLKMESPTLNDGSKPFYMEPVDPGLRTAKAARKWQLAYWPENKQDELVSYCNQNQDLDFEKET